jgi:tetratricopeptide (TPR) repeat protein
MKLKYLFGALALEIGALYTTLDAKHGTVEVINFLALHGGASAFLALFSLPALPEHYRRPRRLVLAYLFSFSFFIPIFGLFGLLVAVLVAVLKPRLIPNKPFTRVKPPEFVLSIREAPPQFRMAGLRSILLDQDTPPEVRLKSLIALQSMPARTAGPLLRKLLSDPADDIRLVAYGMLDSQEKSINARIKTDLDKLATVTDMEARLGCLRHIAELNWELVYSGLVQGDVRRHALASGIAYAERAQEISPQDAGLWFLKGRLLQAAGDIEAAGVSFNIAVSLFLPEARVLPYVAEIAFEQRDFGTVRETIGLIAVAQTSSLMAPLIQFWRPRAAA